MKFSYSCRFVYISKIKFVFVANCICQVWKNVFARIGSLLGWGGAGWQWFWARICVAPAANGRRPDSVKIQSKAAPSLSDFVANTSNRLKRTLLLALAQVFWHFAWYGVVASSQVTCLFSSKHWECKHDKMRCLPRKRGYLQLDRKLIFSSASSFDGNVRAIKCPRLGFKRQKAALLRSVDICTLACHALGRAWQKIIQHDVREEDQKLSYRLCFCQSPGYSTLHAGLTSVQWFFKQSFFWNTLYKKYTWQKFDHHLL